MPAQIPLPSWLSLFRALHYSPSPFRWKYHNCKERTVDSSANVSQWVLAEEVDFPRPSQSLWSREVSTISLDIRARHCRSRVAEGFSQDFKEFLQFHHQSPVTFLKVVSEPILASIYGLSGNLEGKYLRKKHYFEESACNPPCWSPCPSRQNVDQTFWEHHLQDFQFLCTPKTNIFAGKSKTR